MRLAYALIGGFAVAMILLGSFALDETRVFACQEKKRCHEGVRTPDPGLNRVIYDGGEPIKSEATERAGPVIPPTGPVPPAFERLYKSRIIEQTGFDASTLVKVDVVSRGPEPSAASSGGISSSASNLLRSTYFQEGDDHDFQATGVMEPAARWYIRYFSGTAGLCRWSIGTPEEPLNYTIHIGWTTAKGTVTHERTRKLQFWAQGEVRYDDAGRAVEKFIDGAYRETSVSDGKEEITGTGNIVLEGSKKKITDIVRDPEKGVFVRNLIHSTTQTFGCTDRASIAVTQEAIRGSARAAAGRDISFSNLTGVSAGGALSTHSLVDTVDGIRIP
jgi:hypothetical protein